MKIHFPYLSLSSIMEAGITVAEACQRVGHPLNLVCGGNGTCKKCEIAVVEDGTTSLVMACRHPISDNMTILLEPSTQKDKILEDDAALQSIPFDPSVAVHSMSLNALQPSLGGFDFSALSQEIGRSLKPLSWPLIQRFNQLLRDGGKTAKPRLNVVTLGDEVLDLFAGDTPPRIYGLAFDIGTTSVVGFLFDMNTGLPLAQASALNGQISFGADVISRIEYAGVDKGHLNQIHDAIRQTLSDIIHTLCEKAGIPSSMIYNAAYCGNSTMVNLLLKLDPARLGRVPFINTIQNGIDLRDNALGLPVADGCVHRVLPLLGGFVGADTTAVLLGLPTDGATRLMIDLGTNGEIAVGDGSRYLVASTACGPALEGAGLTMGMRGTTGAIEAVKYQDGRFVCEVIGGGPAKGFCGSGIIDAITQLLVAGIVAPMGNFYKGAKLEGHPLAHRITLCEDGQRQFTLLTAEENGGTIPMVITQKDIRAIQLAKGAIHTGCELLLSRYGIQGEDLSEIVISGAFGNYIDIQNAQAMGLLPTFPGVPVRSIGNGAGMGVKRFLLSQEEVARCTALPTITTHVELASDPDFVNTYMMNTQFEDLGSSYR